MAHTETKVLTAHVPLVLAEKIDQLAARLERSRGWIVKQALSAWIDQEEERSRMTREALADVDAGRVIDHQAVQAWADSLNTPPAAVKLVGSNGQISLGKQFAGRQVLVEEREPGVWIVRTATVIPDNERWLHEPQAAAELQAALAWCAAQTASDDDVEDTLKRLGHDQQ